jgi:hypothetical protein
MRVIAAAEPELSRSTFRAVRGEDRLVVLAWHVNA